MTFQVPLDLPQGFPGATPRLALSYSSMSGNNVVGMGWDLQVPEIARLTLRGLPAYSANDVFTADGDELVRVQSDEGQRHYRARFESSFVRYSFRGDPDGRSGYWVAEHPDGSRSFFGAYEQGEGDNKTIVDVPEALARERDSQDSGVFRYKLVKTVDSVGHAVRYHYRLDERGGRTPLVDYIEYLFEGKDPRSTENPRYVVRFDYEPRPDVLSSGLPGFDLRLSERLVAVSVLSGGVLMRRYRLDYEKAGAGTSRLARVEQFGVGGAGPFPETFTFEYSSSLDLRCEHCAKPFVFDMGTIRASAQGGLDFANGRATLIDIDGNALPDLLDTTEGRHHFFVNRLAPDGSQHFETAVASRQETEGFELVQPSVQVLDVQGDGFADVINAQTGAVLCNRGLGDWTDKNCPTVELPADLFLSDGDGDPKGVRFTDANGDRRIDVLRASPGNTELWINTSDGYQYIQVATPLEYGFDNNSFLQLADLNGDGLLDAVHVFDGQVWYRLHLGSGKFGPVQTVPLSWPGPAPTTLNLSDWELQDLNGDGLDDAVAVVSDTVYFALNHTVPPSPGSSQPGRPGFMPIVALDSKHLDGPNALPTRLPDTTILFADMNASGTTDVVWVNPQDGSVKVLELFAVRPNLLTRIENGLGGVRAAEYGSSALQQARDEADGEAWTSLLPQAINVVTATEEYATLTEDVRLRVEYSYRNGFYDGKEKRYRGFTTLEERVAADDSQQASLRIKHFNVGTERAYESGKLELEQVYGESASGPVPLQKVRYEYDLCDVAEARSFSPDYAYPVRFVCQRAVETWLQEGLSETEWRTLRTERVYDGYGNVTLESNLGVIGNTCGPCSAPAGTASGACGDGCRGDEMFVATDYVKPGPATGGSWTLGAAYRTRTYSKPPLEGGAYSETLRYFDGPAFAGLDLGQLDTGLVTKECRRVTPEAKPECNGPGWVESVRVERDDHGNVVTALDPLGSSKSLSGHRREIAYGPYALRPERVTLFLSRNDQDYQLARSIRYHKIFDAPQLVSSWQLLNAPVQSTPTQTLLTYDAFGRRSSRVAPGDSEDAPTEQYSYELGAPVSRVRTLGRTKSGAAPDLETIACVDGLGRTVQSRTRLREGVYQISGFHEVNPHGSVVREYQPYQADSGECDTGRPQQVLATSTHYDAVGRPLRITHPDGALYGNPSETTYEYGPLTITSFDAEDNSADNPIAHNTPHRRHVDGLGRTVQAERFLAPEGETGRIRALWDELGRLAGYLGPTGQRRQQTYDLLGRVVEVDDPNGGRIVFEYDSAGNLTDRTDARNKTVQTSYDGANRPVIRLSPDAPEATRVDMQYDFATDCEECRHGEGKLAVATYPLFEATAVGRDEYGFDLRGRNAFFARTLEDNRFVITTTFDNADRVSMRSYPDGTKLSRHYDGEYKLVGIGGALEDIAYDVRGQLNSLRYENNVHTRYEYDSRQRISAIETWGPDGQALLALGYQHDRVGNVQALNDLIEPGARSLDRSVRYRHDAWYRMEQAEFGTGTETVDLLFDSADNIVHKRSSRTGSSHAHVGDYSYSSTRPNALKRAGDIAFEYNPAGMLVQRGDTTFDWDYQGRLTTARNAGGRAAQYAYGLDNERVVERHDGSTTYYVGPEFEMRDGLSVTYARMGRQRVARLSRTSLGPAVLGDLNNNDAIDVGDAYTMLQRDERKAIKLVYGAARRLLHEHTSANVMLHNDHLQSVTLATSPAGKVLGQRAYYPTGDQRAALGYVDRYGFTGQRRDPITGMVHFQFRELDTQTGRWISTDPLFAVVTPESLALSGEASTAYAYVAGNFSTLIDPTGLASRGTTAQPRARPTHPRTINPYASHTPDSVSMRTFGKIARRNRSAVLEHREERNFVLLQGAPILGHLRPIRESQRALDNGGHRTRNPPSLPRRQRGRSPQRSAGAGAEQAAQTTPETRRASAPDPPGVPPSRSSSPPAERAAQAATNRATADAEGSEPSLIHGWFLSITDIE